MTFLGLAGVGDLVATCVSPLSRNYRVGYAVGKGENLEQAIESLGEVAEGINTLRYIRQQCPHDRRTKYRCGIFLTKRCVKHG